MTLATPTLVTGGFDNSDALGGVNARFWDITLADGDTGTAATDHGLPFTPYDLAITVKSSGTVFPQLSITANATTFTVTKGSVAAGSGCTVRVKVGRVPNPQSPL